MRGAEEGQWGQLGRGKQEDFGESEVERDLCFRVSYLASFEACLPLYVHFKYLEQQGTL